MVCSAIVFPIDGVLVDSNDMQGLAWEEAFASIGVRFERHEMPQHFAAEMTAACSFSHVHRTWQGEASAQSSTDAQHRLGQ
jgi:beta-phosphoglucomutase-like phosphatase (HAD superfamily)